MNFFCWEKSNGRWAPMLFMDRIPDHIANNGAGSSRARHAALDSDVMRTQMQKVEPHLSLSECIALHPMRSE